MSLLEELQTLGVDTADGVARAMGDLPFYASLLDIFAGQLAENAIVPADFDTQPAQALLDRVHLLKGMAANLALTPLHEGYACALNHLQAGQAREAREAYERLLPVQEAIAKSIARHALGPEADG